MTTRLHKPYCESFPPVAALDARVLILGSMPGVESLRQQQYYAHPRNAFWPIMSALFGFQADAPYPARCRHLAQAGVAVWDVLKACHRPGSLDQHIDPASIQANDFAAFFDCHPHISHVFFNGAKAEQLYVRHVLPTLSPDRQHLARTRLPSTSPAHAAVDFSQKCAAWQIITRYC